MKKENEKFINSNIFEGITSIKALIKAKEQALNNRIIETVFYDKNKEKSKRRELNFLRQKSKAHNFELQPVSGEKIEKIAVGSSHGGIIALCGDREIPPLSQNAEMILPNGFYLLLEGIEDPYNFGSALRSVYAAGVNGVILPERNWMGAAGVVARASAGASELLPIYTSNSLDAVKIFRSIGYKIVCADTKEAESVYSQSLHYPIFLIIGGEKRGISRAILDISDYRIKIEYGRHFPAALSASSAAAVLAFEVYRQNRQV